MTSRRREERDGKLEKLFYLLENIKLEFKK
jgi:hypothetical protein